MKINQSHTRETVCKSQTFNLAQNVNLVPFIDSIRLLTAPKFDYCYYIPHFIITSILHPLLTVPLEGQIKVGYVSILIPYQPAMLNQQKFFQWRLLNKYLNFFV